MLDRDISQFSLLSARILSMSQLASMTRSIHKYLSLENRRNTSKHVDKRRDTSKNVKKLRSVLYYTKAYVVYSSSCILLHTAEHVVTCNAIDATLATALHHTTRLGSFHPDSHAFRSPHDVFSLLDRIVIVQKFHQRHVLCVHLMSRSGSVVSCHCVSCRVVKCRVVSCM